LRTDERSRVTYTSWNAPRAGVVADYNRPGHMAELEARTFRTLREFGREVHKLYDARDLDFRLRPGPARRASIAAAQRACLWPASLKQSQAR
jgi:hypothetical protein